MANENADDFNIDIHDRVAEAYYGKLGEKLMQETQHRMHWIRDNVLGNKVLDIGCSQGIGPILLGRLGKKVTGVDISQKAVDEANKELEQEEPKVKENVNFKKSDFLAYDVKKEQFDTITITEVLEHLVNPEDFIEKAKELLVDKGTLIVTVPFGINDHIDHKKTYYFLDLYQMVYKDFDIQDISILGKWIGFILEKRSSSRVTTLDHMDIALVNQIEKGFYSTERKLVDRAQLLYTQLNDANNKYKNVTIQYSLIKDDLKRSQEKFKNLREEYRNTKESASFKLGSLLIHKTKSFTDILKLPVRIMRIKNGKKSSKQSNNGKNKNSSD